MIKIVKAEHLNGYLLHLTFSDGAEGSYDLAPLLAKETELTKPLKSPESLQGVFSGIGRALLEKRTGTQPVGNLSGAANRRETYSFATSSLKVCLPFANIPVI